MIYFLINQPPLKLTVVVSLVNAIFNLFYIHNLLPDLLSKPIVIHSAVHIDMTEIYTIQI